MAIIENQALKRMRAGEPALGMQLRLGRSGEVAGAAKASGHDWVMIDLQHSGMDVATAVEISLACYGFGVTPLVRIPNVEYADVIRLLDAGVMGVILPDVRTAAEARRLVERCKFVPVGTRSVTVGYVALGYEPLPISIAAQALNNETLLACMIESAQGLRNLEEIAAVDGIDVVHLGCNDLLVDLGLPGQFDGPELREINARLIKACQAAGNKFPGSGGDRNGPRQRAFIEAGGRFVTTDSDLRFMMTEALRRTNALRGTGAAS